MIPIKLTLGGLYAYREQQTIDFGRLLEGRLFGIFGPVGSGKSSILEAISFALYGETERLNQREGLNYNMMNLQSDRLSIDFEFSHGPDAQRYRFTVEGRRNKKNFDDVRTFTRKAYRWEPSGWMPLAEADGHKILGLSYDNFRRTVIIPQGRFQEFLLLKDGERANMLEEIFNLKRFNLSDRVGPLESANNEAIARLEGELAPLLATDAATVADMAVRAEALAAEVKAQRENKESLSKQFLEEKKRHEAYLQLQAKEREWAVLSAKAPEMQAREQKLERYEQRFRAFGADLAERRRLYGARQKALEQDRLLADQLNVLQDKLDKESKAFGELRTQFEGRERLRTETMALQQVLRLFEINAEKNILTQKLSAAQALETQEAKALEALRETYSALKNQLKQLQAERPDVDALNALLRWHDERRRKEADRARLQKSIGEKDTDLQGLWRDINAKTPEAARAPLSEAGSETARLEAVLREIRALCAAKETETEQAQAALVALQGRLELKHAAENLRPGEACPLCGATDHPAIQQFEHMSAQMAQTESRLKSLRQAARTLENSKQEVQFLIQGRAQKNAEREALLQESETIAEAMKAHSAAFVWAGFSPEAPQAVEEALASARALDNTIAQTEKQRAELEKKGEQQNAAHQRARNECEALNKQSSVLQATGEQILQQVQATGLDAAPPDAASTRSRIDVLQRAYADLEKKYPAAERDRRKQQEDADRLLGQRQANAEQAAREQAALAALEARLLPALREAGHQTPEEVESLLAEKLPVEQEREALRAHREAIALSQQSLEALRETLQDRPFDPAAYAALNEALQATTENVEGLIGQEAALRAQLASARQQLLRREQLAAQAEVLQLRRDNLRKLKTMFSGNAFVKYVSTSYLQQLCAAANERFARLTRQQLRLEVSGDTGFQVRDYLNEGRLRSVKTLSGGQIFQAALSLALALSEHIQAAHGGVENFFFLDEGFGSQDRASLQAVFETLKALRNENRFVGIISHVDELQQEIDCYLEITHPPEKGSQVRASFEQG